MKRLLIFLFIFILGISCITSAGIQIFKPSMNETINKGKDYTIRWNLAGTVQDFVKIRLFKKNGMIKVLNITDSTSSVKGQFLWKKHLINNIMPGAYVIRVRSINNKVTGDSAPFKIENNKEPNIGIIQVEAFNPSAPKEKIHRHRAPQILEVIAPNGGEKRPGDNLNIRWNNSPGFHGDVKIILQRQSGSIWLQYEVLFPSTHDKNVNWTIYSNRGATLDPIPTGTYYRIRIESVRCPKEIVAIGERFYLR